MDFTVTVLSTVLALIASMPPAAQQTHDYGSLARPTPAADNGCDIGILQTRQAVSSFVGKYMDAGQHRAFAQSASGAWAWRSARTTAQYAAKNALIACQAKNRPNEPTAPCQVIHIDDHWTAACRAF